MTDHKKLRELHRRVGQYIERSRAQGRREEAKNVSLMLQRISEAGGFGEAHKAREEERQQAASRLSEEITLVIEDLGRQVMDFVEIYGLEGIQDLGEQMSQVELDVDHRVVEFFKAVQHGMRKP